MDSDGDDDHAIWNVRLGRAACPCEVSKCDVMLQINVSARFVYLFFY